MTLANVVGLLEAACASGVDAATGKPKMDAKSTVRGVDLTKMSANEARSFLGGLCRDSGFAVA